MRKLNSYRLDPILSLNYLEENLRDTNKLSTQILETLYSGKGEFFVLLPEDSDVDRIHDFNGGYVTACIDEEVCQYIVNRIKNTRLSCVFDDVNRNAADVLQEEFLVSHSVTHEDELYYFLKQQDLSKDSFFKCMGTSNAIWHSLCVVTLFDLKSISSRKLEKSIIEKICSHAQLIMVSSYDGEGYIFWEASGKLF